MTNHYAIIRDSIRSRKYIEAIAECEELIHNSPNHLHCYWYLGLAYLLQGDEVKADESWMSTVFANLDTSEQALVEDLVNILKIEANHFFDQSLLSEAEVIYKKILEIDSSFNDANLRLALIYQHQNDYLTALAKLEEFNKNESAYYLAHFYLGQCYQNLAQIEKSIESYKYCIELNPDFIESYVEIARCYTLKNDFHKALTYFDNVIKLEGGSAIVFNEIAHCYRQLDEIETAIQYLKEGIEIYGGFPEMYSNLGVLLRESGESEQAIQYFKDALEQKPDILVSYYNIAVCYLDLDLKLEAANYLNKLGTACRKSGQLDNSIQYHKQAIELSEKFVPAYNAIAVAYFRKGDDVTALRYLNESIQIDSQNVETYYRFGQLLELSNRLEEALSYVKKGMEIDSDNPDINLIAGRLERRLENLDLATQHLNQCLESAQRSNINSYILVEANFELGYVFDRKKEYASAYQYFLEGNKFQAQFESASNNLRNQYLNRIQKFSRTFTPDWLSSWTKEPTRVAEDAQDCQLAIILGFPRSGTTLLDKVLNSHPDVEVLSEQPVLSETLKYLALQHQPYPESLASLTEDDLSNIRSFYFNESKKYVFLNKTKLLIDKHPFHLVEAGIIHRIFPTAKFIFVIRHPFDVVLSCFMQCFEINEGTAHFFNLNDASLLYQEIIDLWYQYQEFLSIETCQIYYEDLISSFEDSVQNLMTFLNIRWDDSVKRYFEHQHYQKSDRKTYTASYSQVSQPIYQTAKYRWRNYRSFLEPVIPKLAPYAQKFGYPIE